MMLKTRVIHVVTLLALQFCNTAAWVGVNFAVQECPNPPTPAEAANTFTDAYAAFRRYKTFIYDAAYLSALQAVGATHVMVGIPNEELAGISNNANSQANAIVNALKPFAQDMELSIAVGTQPLAPWWNGVFAPHLVGALTNLRQALRDAGLKDSIKVTVPFVYNMLAVSYPPADGAFSSEYGNMIHVISRMLRDDGSTFTVNIYPWFTYRANPQDISLDYALLKDEHTVGGVTYENLMMVQVAAVRAALLRLDPTFTEDGLPIVVGETGWPTAGHVDATVRNANTYIRNVVRLGNDGKINLYLFEAFDEELKQALPGTLQDSVEEKNFGLMYENGTPKFSLLALKYSGVLSHTADSSAPWHILRGLRGLQEGLEWDMRWNEVQNRQVYALSGKVTK